MVTFLARFSVVALLSLCACGSSATSSVDENGRLVNLGAPGQVLCPPVSILPLTGSIAIFEEDMESVLYRASLDSAVVSCATEDEGLPKSADISFTGIAESNKAEIITGELPVFLTVLYQQRVVHQKQVEDLAVVFTPEMNKFAYSGEFEGISIPEVSTSAREDLRFLVGFQLDERQLLYNRREATP